MLNADRECRAFLLTWLTFTNSILLIIQQIIGKLNPLKITPLKRECNVFVGANKENLTYSTY